MKSGNYYDFMFKWSLLFSLIGKHWSNVFQKVQSIVGNKAKMGESQNGCFKKIKHAKFSEKRTFLTPWYAHVKKCQGFFGKFGVLCFLETPVLRFALLPYYRQYWRESFLNPWYEKHVNSLLYVHDLFDF